MSATFSIEGITEEAGYELPCEACGVSLYGALDPRESRHLDCPACLGYGGPVDIPKAQFELNVHNQNCAALLRLVGLESAPEGAADPRDILTKLALVEVPQELATQAAKLAKIASKAAKYDRRVVWA